MYSFSAEFLRYIENKLNIRIDNIRKLINGSYNEVYKIETDGTSYVLRIFASNSWPENGKLEFINEQLAKNNIATAKIFLLERDGKFFDQGFMIQEFIDGYNVEDIIGDKIPHVDYFSQLAHLIKRVHAIKIKNCGYIGTGVASHADFVEFMRYECEKTKSEILDKRIIGEDKLDEYIKIIMDRLSEADDLPFVLCHNDISENNVMLNNLGDLVLIDWDNAISSTWVSDFSAMTYWMHSNYGINDYHKYREIFLDAYNPPIDRRKLDALERTYHSFQCLKLLGYFSNKHDIDKVMSYLLRLVHQYN